MCFLLQILLGYTNKTIYLKNIANKLNLLSHFVYSKKHKEKKISYRCVITSSYSIIFTTNDEFFSAHFSNYIYIIDLIDKSLISQAFLILVSCHIESYFFPFKIIQNYYLNICGGGVWCK